MTRSPFALIFGGLAAIIAVALLIVIVIGEGERGGAHEAEEEHAPAAAPQREVTGSGFRLTVNVAPDEGTVGEVVSIQGRLTDMAGATVRNVRFTLTSHHLEDDVDIFKTTFVAPDGIFNWGNQFWDGTEHEIIITAAPGPDASAQFSPLTLRREVAVTPLPPPVYVQVRALLWLLLPVVVGLAVGIPLGLRQPLARPAVQQSLATA